MMKKSLLRQLPTSSNNEIIDVFYAPRTLFYARGHCQLSRWDSERTIAISVTASLLLVIVAMKAKYGQSYVGVRDVVEVKIRFQKVAAIETARKGAINGKTDKFVHQSVNE